jgi:pimeloyl-ACP methyl ester carboxylesterase
MSARLALVILLGALTFGVAAPARAQSTPAFTPSDCAALTTPLVDTPLNALLPAVDERMRCGYVTVPETHGSDDGRTLQLAVVVLGATGDQPHAAPLFVMQGGPGGGTIDTYQVLLRSHALRSSRDIVLFDQRGTGRSLPSLRCTETYDLAVRTAEERMTYTESTRMSEDALVACRSRLASSDVDLGAFDSIENARDIDDVRRALGYDKIDLYGVSYGSELALHAMREVPAALRTVILDAVAPVAGSFLTDVARSEDRALTAFFSACASDPTCAAEYPDLENTYFALVAALDQTPLRMRVDDPNSGQTYSVPLDGATLQELFFQLLYSKEMLPLLPKLIDDLRHGDVRLAGNVTSLFAFDRSVAQGMYFSVTCADDAGKMPTEPNFGDVRQQIAERAAQDSASLRRICRAWNVDAMPAEADQPVRSAIPTLLLNGAFDPITPPQNGVAVAASLENSYVFTFPNTAHGAFPTDACADGIVQAFLADPTRRPDDACVRGAEPLTFVGRDELIDAPVVGQLLTAPSTVRQWEFLVLTAALLALLSSLLFMPLGWFVRLVLRGKRPQPTLPFMAKLMPWATALQTMLVVVFVVGFFGGGVAAAAENDYSFLAGVRSTLWPLFTLPPAMIFLTIVMAWGTLAGTRSGGWGFVRSAYRVLLVAAAITICIVLARWDVVLPIIMN